MKQVGKYLEFSVVAGMGLIAAVILLSILFGGGEREPAPAPQPRELPAVVSCPGPSNDAGRYATGWLGPAAAAQTQELLETLPEFEIERRHPRPFGAAGDRRDKALLWRASRKVLGRDIHNTRQQIGDCVSWGFRNAVAYLLAVTVAMGAADEWHNPYPPYIYGTSRVQVGGGRIHGDGSLGIWATKAIQRYGVLSADAEGVPDYSGSVARAWGSRGPPEQFMRVAGQFDVQTVSQTKSADDAWRALINGYPVAICSMFGSSHFRLIDGRYVAVGDASWNHCMCLIGCVEIDGRRYYYCMNSWGEEWGPPTPNGEPPGGFWITNRQCQRIMTRGRGFALSNFLGFKARDIDFNLIGETDAKNHRRGRGPGLRGRGRDDRPAIDSFAKPDLADADADGDRLARCLRVRGHDGDRLPGGFRLGMSGRGPPLSDSLFHVAGLHLVSAIQTDRNSSTLGMGLADWPGAAGEHPNRRCGRAAATGAKVRCERLPHVRVVARREGEIPADRVSDGRPDCGLAQSRAGLFGPDEEMMAELAERFATEAVDEAVAAMADHQRELIGAGCLVAGTGGAVVIIIVFIGRALLMMLERWLSKSR